ncbi:PMT family glycosyltransferase, 4-amino-4-deoxy-L-arabinose transferase [Paramagnetospirillum caucaseum]|uniref:PMT family glycosyltransferase, 4-amino-4-deoxy-L-arabinose transferase n=1 Tax=Paramagnetospirillum caucaseum TaxID=1244869 RepID=M2ZT32_9PROT|nr:glycosyltransferase family 39 protein [Paramagnetospirillum caucaseum]EME70517.1 PMT family glycosyltransferase, 4-amino-4-deoxy-L-arabinose transferase [Paramagnetospirillum caucaseum]
MTAALGLPLLLAGCLGWGAIALRLLGLIRNLRQAEALAWSFALGQGIWGWLMFWIGTSGHLNAGMVAGGLLAGMVGCLLLSQTDSAPSLTEGGRLHPLLILAAAGSAAMLALEAISPPTDADSLAYHFALARDFAQAGRIVFVARAIDGAVPLLTQMHYTAAFTLGGEIMMTAWAATLSAGMVLVLYALARIWLNRNWSAMTALAFATLPATIYGAGSGQVEVKLGLLVIIGALAAARAVERGCVRHAAVAGVAAGFFVASKYTGLLFAVALGLVLLLPAWRWRLALVFTATALLAGFQWYGWNWLHMGDPLFPTLRPWLPPSDPSVWPLEFHAWHKRTWNEGELALSRTPWSLLVYPFLATFTPPPALDSARVGLGALPMALLPLALGAAWTRRDTPGARILWRMLAVALVFGGLWFFLGASQRIRHFLPILPVLLLAASVAAERLTRNRPARQAIIAAFILAIGLQLAGQAIYAQRFARDLWKGASRDQRLAQSVSYYDAVRWINTNLGSEARVIHDSRFLNYLLTVPYYNAHPTNQALVDLSPAGDEIRRFLAGLCRAGGTHVLAVGGRLGDGSDASVLKKRMDQLRALGLAETVTVLDGRLIESRTLGGMGATIPLHVFKIHCQPDMAGNGKIR